jgi:protocatechuate 3,4-dioxygenase beta subunit
MIATRRRLLAAGLLLPLDALAQSCGAVTLRQTKGPFFKSSSPLRTSLVEPSSKTRFVLTGRVLSPRCEPISNAMLDFWHADEEGDYDNRGYRHRGHLFTDAQGRFRVESIVPGSYPGRTRHYHVNVQPQGKGILTTQLYFAGEKGNKNDFLYRPELEIKAGKPGEGSYEFVVDV